MSFHKNRLMPPTGRIACCILGYNSSPQRDGILSQLRRLISWVIGRYETLLSYCIGLEDSVSSPSASIVISGAEMTFLESI
jgi:hypothetical protein